jgi:hypothetical protein
MDRLDGVKATREYMQDLKMSLSSLWLSRDWDLEAGVIGTEAVRTLNRVHFLMLIIISRRLIRHYGTVPHSRKE